MNSMLPILLSRSLFRATSNSVPNVIRIYFAQRLKFSTSRYTQQEVPPFVMEDRGGRTSANSLTPLYLSIRKIMDANPGCVCLVQVGSFYELYFDQATVYGPQLGIKVVNRASGLYSIPMCGFPVYQLQKFMQILVLDLLKTVAVVDQITVGDQKVIHREVSRILSPGTLVEETFMNYSQNNYLLGVSLPPVNAKLAPADPDTPIGLSWIDLSVGEFYVQQSTLGDLISDVSRINPSEIILPKEYQDFDLTKWFPPMQNLKRHFTRYHKVSYGNNMIKFKASSQLLRKTLESFSVKEEAAMNMILSYLHVNFPHSNVLIDLPIQYWNEQFLQMDANTRDSLELIERSSGGRHLVVGSLLNTIKRTKTASGTRLLTQWIKSPSLDIPELLKRQSFVSMFMGEFPLEIALRQELANLGDISRSLQRLNFDTGDTVANLVGVADGLTSLASIERLLQDNAVKSALVLKPFISDFKVPEALSIEVNGTLEQPPDAIPESAEEFDEDEDEIGIPVDPINSNEISSGSYTNKSIAKFRKIAVTTPPEQRFAFQIKKDHDPALAALHNDLEKLHRKEETMIAKLAAKFYSIDPKISIIGKSTLGKFSNVLHISGKQKLITGISSMLGPGVLSQRKTAILYKPNNWSMLQHEIDLKIEIIQGLELTIIRELRRKIIDESSNIRKIIKLTDYLDVTSSLAVLARELHLVCPKFLKTLQLKITGGRHLVVETGLKDTMFTPNDTSISASNPMWVITGPNMGGKSTFLRQNAIIVILAQIGSFVPAEKASLGIVDKIFTRIGASDDLYNDLSTFMVEMVETSNILKNATSRSLAIVDEIGRGTSGKEGLAIAYATLIHLLTVNKCRTLFATHFGNEINSLLEQNNVKQTRIQFHRTRVLHESEGGLIIDHTLEPGISERSYALEVAQMAGFPQSVLHNARQALKLL